MQINWFEVVVQIINFVVLLLILQKLLYKPVIRAMEERQQKIDEDLSNADHRMREAEAIIESYSEKMATVAVQEKEILEKAAREAFAEKESLLKHYQNQANEKRTAFFDEVEEEKHVFSTLMKKSLGKNAIKLAGHILKTVASQDVTEQAFQAFIAKIQGLDNLTSLEDENLIVISATGLPEDKKVILERTLEEKFGKYRSLTYQIDETLIVGFELAFETFILHHNVKKYLEESEKDILDTVEHRNS